MRFLLCLTATLTLMATLFCACGSSMYPDDPAAREELERQAEKAMVQTAVRALMVDEGLSDLSRHADGTPTGAPVWTYAAGSATNDMSVFPSAVWRLYSSPNRRYVRDPITDYFYTVELDGTVRQFADAAKTQEFP